MDLTIIIFTLLIISMSRASNGMRQKEAELSINCNRKKTIIFPLKKTRTEDNSILKELNTDSYIIV